jgi:hypothetical protein
MKTGSYLNVFFWPRVQHCSNVASVMDGDKQPTRETNTHIEKPGGQTRNRAKTVRTGYHCIA